jgi:hypothetical protein
MDCRFDGQSPSFFEINRRRFLEVSAGAASLSFLPTLPAWAKDKASSTAPRGKAKHVIVLYMAGGASQIDTFDPKPGRPTAGKFKPIDTSIKGVQFSEHLPQMAKMAGEISVIRSMSTKEGNHRRASYLMRTGHAPQGPVKHPGFGALVSHYKGKESFDLPNYVSISNPSVGGGFLGIEYSPFVVNDPTKPVANLNRPGSTDRARFKRRWKLLERAEKRFAKGRRDDMVQGHSSIYEQAESFMHSKLAKAFDCSKESEAVRSAYGKNKFGQGVLMARRLVEVGVPFVEVTLGGWDTHRDNFDRVKQLSSQLDPAFAQLLRDLKKSKLLEETIVVWMGDFGRTPRINGNGGRDHFPRAWTSVVAGAGFGRGVLLGNSGKDGNQAQGRVVKAADLYKTFAHLLGINSSEENISRSGRPITVVEKEGKMIKEIL